MSFQRIILDNVEYEGENNAYLLDGTETALIDPGYPTPENRAQLQDGLAESDLTFADIDVVYLTHHHSDHAGMAGEIQREGGARVYAHELDAPLIAHDPTAVETTRATRERRFEEWGIPPDKRAALRDALGDFTDGLGDPPDVEPLSDGETVTVAGRTLTAHHTPGHAAGHLVYSFTDEQGARGAYTGDALLPKYTPNVGGADVRVAQPLDRYLETLRWIVDADFDYALPGHRSAIDSPASRAQEILDHHRTRSQRVLEALASHQPADAWTVSAHLFGDLSDIHILHGPGEAYAHLDHLTRTGDVARTPSGYVLATDAN
jgi:glyoxylase-like metal-dependent hydrolase (beta-lactamase superfamily II)